MKQHAARGFTLLEVLVALTLFSLVLVILYAGYRLSVRSWESGERSQAAVADLRLAGSFIRRYVSQALPLAVSDSNAWRLWFAGQPGRLVFVTAMPAHLGQGGMYEMTVHAEEQDDGIALMVSRRLLHPDAEPGKPGVDDHDRPLVESLASAQFDYFGATEEQGAESWHSRWDSNQRLPRLVRLRLTSTLAGEWPDIVIRLPADLVRYQRTVADRGPGQQIPRGGGLGVQGPILAPGLGQ